MRISIKFGKDGGVRPHHADGPIFRPASGLSFTGISISKGGRYLKTYSFNLYKSFTNRSIWNLNFMSHI